MKHPAKRARIWIALALCLTLLTACTSGGDQKAAAFEQAKSLLASGRISDAASAFAQLTGYEDADTYAAYVEAARLRQTGDYTAAAKAFGALNGFGDSKEQEAACLKLADATAYDAAATLLREGQYDKAAEGFAALSGYEDASLQAMYAKALELAEKGEYDLGIGSLKTLDSFRDSRIQAIYYEGRQAEDAQDYESADAIYRTVAAFRDSQGRLDLLADHKLDQSFAAAASQLSANGWTDEVKALFEGLADQNYTTGETVMNERLGSVASKALTDGNMDAAEGLYTLLEQRGVASARDGLNAVAVAKATALAEEGKCEEAMQALEGIETDEAKALRKTAAAELAKKAEADGDLAKAYEMYVLADDVEDGAAKAAAIQERYVAAVTLLGEGKFDEAHEAFESLGTYGDAGRMALETLYRKAVAMVNAGEWEEAVKQFEALGEFSDAAIQAKAVWYHKAEKCMEEGKWEEASEAFAKAGDYSDAKERILEPFYAEGEQLLEAGDEVGAFAAFTKAGDYKDAAVKLQAIYYAQGVRYENAAEWDKAMENYMKAGDYEDAKEKVEFCAEQRRLAVDAQVVATFSDFGGEATPSDASETPAVTDAPAAATETDTATEAPAAETEAAATEAAETTVPPAPELPDTINN